MGGTTSSGESNQNNKSPFERKVKQENVFSGMEISKCPASLKTNYDNGPGVE